MLVPVAGSPSSKPAVDTRSEMMGRERALCSNGLMKVTHSLVLVAVAILQMDQEEDSRIWGYALSKKSGVRSGVLYPQLDRMLGEGWLADHWEENGHAKQRPPRRYYTVTDAGRMELGAVVKRAEREPRFAGVKVGIA